MKIEKVRIYPCLKKSLSQDAAYRMCKVRDELPLDVVINHFMNMVEIKSNSHESLDIGIEVVRIISAIEKTVCKCL